MVKATAACLHRVFLAQNYGEGNGRLPSACLFGTQTMVKATAACLCCWHENHGEGNGRLPSPCVFSTKTIVKATAACLHRVFLAPKPW